MILNFDESGNMGKQGRYFNIACVGGAEMKPLENVIGKSILKVKKEFPQYADLREIKASHSNPSIKDYILNKIISKDIFIRYIVADLKYTNSNLIEDENLLYNFLLKKLIIPIAKEQINKKLTLNIDKRSIKVGSTNSFEDYIKIQLNYELKLNIDIKVHYIESQNSLSIQAADFVSNAIYAKYEYNNNYYYDILKPKIQNFEKFPYANIGM